MRGAMITVCESFDGTVALLYKGKEQPYTTYKRVQKPQPVADEKTINQTVDQAIKQQSAVHKPQTRSPMAKTMPAKTPKADTSIWGKTGHFYFALTGNICSESTHHASKDLHLILIPYP